MKKSTKIVSMVIAVTLVMAIMTFVIYAATAGKVGINASVSWTAQAGVDLEFWGRVSGGDTTKEITKTYINPTTTNATAKIVDDLSCNFSDNTDDGVNNPNAIVFRYYVRNKSLTPLKIQVTKYPTQAEESGTSEADHTPKVELSSQVGEENTLVSAIGAGYELKAGDLFEYSVTLSMASGGTGNINADTGLAPNFDAGVTFNFTVGGNSNGTIVTSVDGATPTSVSSSTLSGQTLGEYLATQQTAEYSTGWFFDEGLTKVVSDDYLTQDLKDSSLSSFYNRTASITGLVFTLSDDGNSYLVSGESSTSPSGEVVIPNMYNGKPVSGFNTGGFSSPTFKENVNITSVILSNNILNISDSVFKNCVGIKSVTIPDSITLISNYAFYGCSGLLDICFPSSVIRLNENSFEGCSNLINVNIPNGVRVIGTSVFSECTNLANVTLGNGLTSIGSGVFNKCTNLTNVEIEDGLTLIRAQAFYGCTSLTSIVIPNSVTTMERAVFSGCTNLVSVVLPSQLENIEESLFSDCRKLASITIPSTVKNINGGSFYYCNSLSSFVVPKNVEYIALGAFTWCGNLANISVEYGNSVYDSRNDCNAVIKTATNELILGGSKTVIPNNVTTIMESSFMGRTSLKSIVIPNSVKTIKYNAFYGCYGLTEVNIPDSVTEIAWQAFYCSGLKKINIGKGVKTIGELAFRDCGFTSITIPGNVETIGVSAFYYNNSLTNVNINYGVKKIDNKAFIWCGKLINISIPDSVESIGQEVFKGCEKITKIFIPKSVTSITSIDATTSIFNGCSSTLQIYCEASEKPDGWGEYWNYRDSTNQLNVTWGVSRAEFEAL